MLVQLDRPLTLLPQSPGQNDCGPHAAAMAIGFYRPELCNAELIAEEIRFLRVPGVGATLPWGITYALRHHGLQARGGWFVRFEALLEHVAANRPAIVLVKPTDMVPCPWYTLHYRVLVGYHDDPSQPGGGSLFFNCSATPPRPSPNGEPGNLTVDYAKFQQQWRTYLTRNWAVGVA